MREKQCQCNTVNEQHREQPTHSGFACALPSAVCDRRVLIIGAVFLSPRLTLSLGKLVARVVGMVASAQLLFSTQQHSTSTAPLHAPLAGECCIFVRVWTAKTIDSLTAFPTVRN